MSPVINYDELAESYTSNLNTMLRSFQTRFEFLNLWVHDDDDTLSILNMIESAGAFQIKKLSIQVSASKFGSIDMPRLKTMADTLATLDVTSTPAKHTIEVQLR